MSAFLEVREGLISGFSTLLESSDDTAFAVLIHAVIEFEADVRVCEAELLSTSSVADCCVG